MIHDQPFQHFSFLCRDYGNFSENCSFEKNVEEAKNSGNEYFENTANGENKVYNNVIYDNEQEQEAQLLNMFKTSSSVALPNPGYSIASKSSSGKISEISDRFRKMVGYYIESIIGNIEPLQVKEEYVKAKDFSSYLFIIITIIQIYD